MTTPKQIKRSSNIIKVIKHECSGTLVPKTITYDAITYDCLKCGQQFTTFTKK